jgi:uncharacterized protein YegL
MTSTFRALALALACALAAPLALVAAGPPAHAAGEKKAGDATKELSQALQAQNKAGVVSALKALGEAGDEKAAKTILQVALDIDRLSKFKAEDSNDIFDAAEDALAAMKDPKGQKFIHESVTKHKDIRVRVFLCDVVAKRPGDDAEAALVSALDDKSPLVAKSALAHLGIKKSAKGVDAAIAIVGRTEKKREEPWLDALRYLTSLTAKDLATAQEWKDWWAANKATFDPKKVSGSAKTGQAGVGETVSRGAPDLFGTEVLSKRCVFILDVSGSMAIKDPLPEAGKPRPVSVSPKDSGYGEVPAERMRMHRLKEAMVKLIQELPADTKFTIVTFATSVRSWEPNLVDANAGNKAQATDFAQAMQPEGFTVTDEALRAAFEVPDANTFYLFSDGIPQRGKNADGTPQHIDRKEILEEVEQLNRTRKVKIFTIGIGEADPNFMRQLATANGGTFVAVQ